MPFSFILEQPCSNNIVEYQALILELEMALEIELQCLRTFGDSQLVVNQVKNEYEIKKPDLLSYHNKASHLLKQFEDYSVLHVSRGTNYRVDALAELAATFAMAGKKELDLAICQKQIVPSLDTTQAISECL